MPACCLLGRGTRTRTRRYNYSTKWKSIHLSSAWKLTPVRICFPRFINVWKNSGSRGIMVSDTVAHTSCIHVYDKYIYIYIYIYTHEIYICTHTCNMCIHAMARPQFHRRSNILLPVIPQNSVTRVDAFEVSDISLRTSRCLSILFLHNNSAFSI